ncbi:putative monooxygenase [Obba rivulosa]|uniref:Putative monooxygenase n=1 Tax=Obba rivulosa TaxID=1052685 RepID=A0A8E2ARB0_9APHY|nr:putative monooxygenase [Obba rivulosa]
MMGLLNTDSLLVQTLFAGVLLVFIAKQFFGSRKMAKLAPGPTRWPFLGNALQLPQQQMWLTFSDWAKTYGDVIHVDVFGQPIIVINSAKVAKDLLDKRSSIYSDRPHLVMAGDLVGYNDPFVLQPYGEKWRKQRKFVASDFSPITIPRYYPLQETEARKLVRNVLANPDSLFPQTKLRIGTIIIRVTYGYYIKDENDPFLTLPLTAMDNFSKASAPGTWLVDFVPKLKNMPSWMPGAGFLETAKKWRKIVWDASWDPYNWCKNNLDTGETLMPNLCGTTIQSAEGKLSKEDEEQLVWAASAIMGGGLDTNMSTSLSFFLAMVLHPDVQKKAQAEIDAVIGRDRLPSIADRESLPYVRSVITEVLRWKPPVPLSVPHSLTQDDVYEGIFLPKGSLIMPNVWHMLHDPEAYPEPASFKPGRYNNSDAEMRKVHDLVFGFGRRSCPGVHFAEGTLFAIVSTVLATVDVLPALDAQGKAIKPDPTYSSGTITFPDAFPLRLKARSKQAETLLAQVPSAPQ